MSYPRYLAVMAVGWIPWNIFWGTLMYNVRRVPIQAHGFLEIFAVYLGIWFVVALIRVARAVMPANGRS